MRNISRRGFLATSGAALGALPLVRSIDALAQVTNPVFRHGVASGDPLSDRVILWTRVTPASGAVAQSVSWELARDEKFTRVVTRGELQTGAARDFTVKVDAVGLEPGTTYYYRFQANKEQSPIGRTKTLPAEQRQPGPAWRRLVLEPSAGLLQRLCLPREPRRRCGAAPRRLLLRVSQQAVRRRHRARTHSGAGQGDSSRCRNTASATRSTRRIPIRRKSIAGIRSSSPGTITSSRNNTWWGGAENHTPATEGDWAIRRAAAVQSYYEWMPIREDLQTLTPRIYRTFRFGDLATLFMLDTRLVGRDQEVDRKDLAALASPSRSLLGAAQENWLAREFAESVRNNTTWNVLGQQVMFAHQSAPGTAIPNADTWDGYQASREHVFDMIEQLKVNNLAVLTGDIHSSWAYDLPRRPYDGYDRKGGKGSLGVEFAGTSVSSPSSIGAGPDGAKQIAGFMANRPHLHYVDGRYRGYFILDLTQAAAAGRLLRCGHGAGAEHEGTLREGIHH